MNAVSDENLTGLACAQALAIRTADGCRRVAATRFSSSLWVAATPLRRSPAAALAVNAYHSKQTDGHSACPCAGAAPVMSMEFAVRIQGLRCCNARKVTGTIEGNSPAELLPDTRLAPVCLVRATAEELVVQPNICEAWSQLTPDQRLVCLWTKAGFSTSQIANHLGRSAADISEMRTAAATMLRRALEPARTRCR
jgi:hypothetical protein